MMEEIILRDFLAAKLAIPVMMEHPVDADTFIILERIGGSRRDRLSRASFSIQSYAASLFEACSLNDRVLGAMEELESDPRISALSLDSFYNYTDETMKKYRYQAVYDIVFF